MQQSEIANRFLSKTSAAFLMRVVAAGTAFLLNVAVSRLMGAEEAGLFFLGQTCLIILAALSRWGTDNVLLRFVSAFCDQGRFDAANSVLIKALSIVIVLSSVVGICLFLAADVVAVSIFSKPEMRDVLRASTLCIIPFSCFQAFSFAIQGRHQVATSIAINAVVLPAGLLVAVLLPTPYAASSASQLMWIGLGIAAFNTGVAAIVWLKRTTVAIDASALTLSELNSMAFPLVCATAVSLIATWVPLLMVASFEPADQIAMLSNCQKTATLVGLLLMAVNSAAAPIYAAMHADNQQEGLRRFAARVNGVLVLSASPLLIATFVFAPQILSIFGTDFRDGGYLLRILIVGQFVNTATGSVGYLLNMSGNEKLFRNAMIASAVTSLLLSVWLVPRYGVYGGAIAVSLSLIVSNVFSAVQVNQRLGINVLKPDLQFAFSAVRRALAPRG